MDLFKTFDYIPEDLTLFWMGFLLDGKGIGKGKTYLPWLILDRIKRQGSFFDIEYPYDIQFKKIEKKNSLIHHINDVIIYYIILKTKRK